MPAKRPKNTTYGRRFSSDTRRSNKGPARRSIVKRILPRNRFGGVYHRQGYLRRLFEALGNMNIFVHNTTELAKDIKTILRVRENDRIRVSPPIEDIGRELSVGDIISIPTAKELFEKQSEGFFIVKVTNPSEEGPRYFRIDAFEYPSLYRKYLETIS